jgi:hypothetical protein
MFLTSLLSNLTGYLQAEAEGIAAGEKLSPLIRWIGFLPRTNSTTGDSA